MVITANGFQMWITAVILSCGVTIPGIWVFGAPIDIGKTETPFPLELQPPLIDNLQDAIDSYGNPIKFSQPIATPDGRKVISTHGVQFEIPNYASGITEIKKPINNLVPPFIDPIAVAIPNDADSNLENDDSALQQYTLPDWLAVLNDPDIGPAVPYVPMDDANSLKILSWDLVPPQRQDPETSLNFGFGQQKGIHVTLSPGQSFAFNPTVQVTTSRPTTTTTTPKRTTSTTTRRPTTTTTTATTTTRPPPLRTTAAIIYTSSSSNSAEIFTLPGGNSNFLPSWLEGYEDPELSVAVPFEVPEDNNEYNHTLSTDLLPPFEPFEDLKVLSVPGLAEKRSQVQSIAPSIINFPSTTTTIPTTIHTTTIRPFQPSTTPFQFKLFSKQTVTPQTTTTKKTSFFTAPTATTTIIPPTTTSSTTESPISNRISQFTLKSVAQPTGFKSNAFLAQTQSTAAVQAKPTAPPRPVLDVKYNPFLTSRLGQAGFPSVITTTTTSTTTQAPTTPASGELIFDSATIPSWLSDIKDSNLGPGVPFTLPGSSDPKQVYDQLVPPLVQVEEQTIDGVTIQKSISSELPSLSFIHNSILSQSVPTSQSFAATTVQEPSILFTPPIVVASDDNDNGNTQSQTNSILNDNFPAATEPTTKTTSKITFNKSGQGKVISNSITASRPTQEATKPIFGFAQPTAPSGFTSATLSPGEVPKTTTTATVFTGKYTGSFGGAPGFLGGQNKPGYAIQPDGSIRDPDHTIRPAVKVAAVPVIPAVPVAPVLVAVQPRIDVPIVSAVSKPTSAPGPKRVYTGTFGGPPGVLVPFDNVRSA